MFDDIELKQDGIYEVKKDKKGNRTFIKVANYMKVIGQEINLDTNEHFVNLEFKMINDSKCQLLKVQASDIASYNSLSKLASKGLDVNEVNKQKVIKALRISREQAPYKYLHQTLGFIQRDNELIFNHHNSYGSKYTSTYVGELDIAPKGNNSVYMNMIKSEVIGTLGLELALVFGVSSATVSLINTRYPTESLMVHLMGLSSSGKSTTASLASSVWGDCNLRGNGLMSSFNTTLNALQKRLQNNYGVIQCLDELNQYSGNDITKVIYSLSEGRIRSRLTKEGEMNKAGSWTTLILSTGEKSMLEMASQNEGLRVRAFEFSLNKWTRSAENSSKIKSIISQNYGWLGLNFVQKITELGIERVIEIYDQWKVTLEGELKKTPFTDRVAAKLAILLTSAQILNEEMNLLVNVQEIKEFLVSSMDNVLVETDLAKKAYRYLNEYLSVNRTLFMTESKQSVSQENLYPISNCQGKIFLDSQGKIEKVAIQKNEFERIIKLKGFESPNMIVKKWKENQWLECESGRTSNRLVINQVRVTCYVIKVQVVEKALGYDKGE